MAISESTAARGRSVFLVVFALSGFAGLIYEAIWSRYLGLLLGHAAHAQALVLATFMGGMALGAWFCGRYSTRWRGLLRGYALAEAVIGLFALTFHPLFEALLALSTDTVLPALGPGLGAGVYRWSLAALLILPQSVLLGMTFPLMSAGLLRREAAGSGRTIALLYFANSLGGAFGVLAAGFVFLPLSGLPGTMVSAGVLNLGLAALVWRLAGKDDPAEARARPRPADTRPAPRGGLPALMLLVALFTGAASFAYEIGWIRMLSLVLGSSTHAFELMLSAFILGLALGGLWIRGRIDALTQPLAVLAWVQLAMGLLALATLPVYGGTFNVMRWLLEVLERSESGYVAFSIASHLIALAVMLPATICAGMTLPLVTVVLLRAGGGEGSIGKVYGANTLGAILGVFLAVHFGLPYLGLKGLIAAGAGLDMVLGVVLLLRLRGGLRAVAAVAAAATAMALVVGGVRLDHYKMASGVFRHGDLPDADNVAVLDHRDGKTASIALTLNSNGRLVIRTNGNPEGAVQIQPNGTPDLDEATMALAGVLPLLLAPGARTAANIGWGTGLTTHTLLAAESLERVDSIEIEPAVFELARAFRPHNARAYDDPRSRIHFEDARTFFATQSRRYDIIISEPSNLWISGVAGLYSQEFYRLLRRHLTEDGMLLQWLQLYEIDLASLGSVMAALTQSFPHYQIFATNRGDMVIVARAERPLPALDGQLFANPLAAAELARIDVHSLEDIEIRKVGGERLLAPFLASLPLRANSDFYPVVDLAAARARFLKNTATVFISHIFAPLPLLEVMGELAPRRRVTAVSPNRLLTVRHPAYQARMIRDALLGSHDPSGAVQDAQAANEAFAEARRILARCAAARPGEDKIALLFHLTVKLAGYLRPQELAAVWSRLETLPCATGLDAREDRWLMLFQAVAGRDPAAMARVAGRLLEADEALTQARRRYLAGAAMLGHVAQGDGDAAGRVWTRYRRRIFPDEAPWMLFRLLAAHSGHRPDG
jgi:predicted membrane-bound spermidine synthase